MAGDPLRGLFLDLDGTLADSMPVLEAVYLRFLGEQGRQGSASEFRDLAGMPLLATVARLKQSHHLDQPVVELLARYDQLVDEVYQSAARPTPGSRELLAAAQARGLAVAVVTSAREAVARGFLAHHGLAGQVGWVVGVEATRRGKPHPDPYQKALALTRLLPQQALAAEDTSLGAAAALAAGLRTYIVRGAGSCLEVPGAAGYITRLDELIPLLGG